VVINNYNNKHKFQKCTTINEKPVKQACEAISYCSLSYSLWPRSHNKTPITKSTQLNDRDFLIKSIYKDSYFL